LRKTESCKCSERDTRIPTNVGKSFGKNGKRLPSTVGRLILTDETTKTLMERPRLSWDS